ncbi:hypothetical protein [Jiella pelagia]|uniref:Uncharacterized protein n=1 Tax=Jiella pelagia TaxID=2986949 RepID=A0ABY7C2L4_9HYPH|nr:hypothetical protein [Jiella pelagia]WAP69872.1 hypothetical protein OH818_06705 [Jiella pelagia]
MHRLRGIDQHSKLRLDEACEAAEAPEGAFDSASAGIVDLLADVPYFSPHDIRRGFATAVSGKTSRADAVSAVLDHSAEKTGRTGEQIAASALVTDLFYYLGQRMELKAEALEIWAEMVIAEFDRISEEHQTAAAKAHSGKLPKLPGKRARARADDRVPWRGVADGAAPRFRLDRVDQRATAGRLMRGSSLKGATDSSVMYLAR